MNLLQQKMYTLIQKYETRLEAKKQQLRLNQNDCVEGVIIAMEEVIADLKEISK